MVSHYHTLCFFIPLLSPPDPLASLTDHLAGLRPLSRPQFPWLASDPLAGLSDILAGPSITSGWPQTLWLAFQIPRLASGHSNPIVGLSDSLSGLSDFLATFHALRPPSETLYLASQTL